MSRYHHHRWGASEYLASNRLVLTPTGWLHGRSTLVPHISVSLRKLKRPRQNNALHFCFVLSHPLDPWLPSLLLGPFSPSASPGSSLGSSPTTPAACSHCSDAPRPKSRLIRLFCSQINTNKNTTRTESDAFAYFNFMNSISCLFTASIHSEYHSR